MYLVRAPALGPPTIAQVSEVSQWCQRLSNQWLSCQVFIRIGFEVPLGGLLTDEDDVKVGAVSGNSGFLGATTGKATGAALHEGAVALLLLKSPAEEALALLSNHIISSCLIFAII